MIPRGRIRQILKALFVVEMLAVVMSMAGVLLPRRSSRAVFDLPPDLATYFRRVLITFGLLNGVLISLAVVIWLYSAATRRAEVDGEHES